MSARPTLRDYARGAAAAVAILLLFTLACGGLIVACGEPQA